MKKDFSAFVGFMAVIVVFILYGAFSADVPTSGGSGRARAEEPGVTVKFGEKNKILRSVFGCQDQDTFKTIRGYLIEKDDLAFKNALTANIMTGECSTFNVGEDVSVEDSTFTQMIKIRRPGETESYWTIIESVTKNE